MPISFRKQSSNATVTFNNFADQGKVSERKLVLKKRLAWMSDLKTMRLSALSQRVWTYFGISSLLFFGFLFFVWDKELSRIPASSDLESAYIGNPNHSEQEEINRNVYQENDSNFPLIGEVEDSIGESKNSSTSSEEGTTYGAGVRRVQPIEVRANLVEKCSFFIDRLGIWQEAAGKQNKAVAWKQASGTGDRLAGLLSVFYYGLTSQKRIELLWDNLDAVFQPSWFMRDILSIIGDSGRRSPQVAECTKSSCDAARLEEDSCPSTDMHLVDQTTFIRGCISKHRCSELNEHYPLKPSLVELAGCPLRLMFEYTEKFLDSKVQYFMDGKVHSGTLRKFAEDLRRFKVVALHYRAGDKEMTSPGVAKIKKASMEGTTTCLGSVGRFIDARGKTTDSRPVKWLIASDSSSVRSMYRDEFPDQVVQLLIQPQHISKSRSKNHTQTVVDIFQEYYLLGLADEIVTNYRKQRLSGFSKFARLMNLKSRLYITSFRGSTCLYKEMDIEGNTRTIPQECSQNEYVGYMKTVLSPITNKKERVYAAPPPLPQEHMKFFDASLYK